MTKNHEVTVEDFNSKFEKDLASTSVPVGNGRTKLKILYFSVSPAEPHHFHYGVSFGNDVIEYDTIEKAIAAYNEIN